MERVFKEVHEFSTEAEICYHAQNKAFSHLELPLIHNLLEAEGVREILDVGTGDGSYLTRLADKSPEQLFTGVDADPNLIESAKRQYEGGNIRFVNEEFNEEFNSKEYDLILARFSTEHSGDAQLFLRNICDRVRPGGKAMITEWLAGDLLAWNPTWKLFREKELAIYEKFGSFSDLPLKVPQLLNTAGFTKVKSAMLHIAPSTIGATAFYDLVIAYANLYATLDNLIWTDEVTERIVLYAEESKINPPKEEDMFIISQTVGNKI